MTGTRHEENGLDLKTDLEIIRNPRARKLSEGIEKDQTGLETAIGTNTGVWILPQIADAVQSPKLPTPLLS